MRFGFASFLKILCLKREAQRAVFASRILGTGERKRGYDFHKRMRAFVARRAAGETLKNLLVEVEAIQSVRERKSIVHGLQQYEAWAATLPPARNAPISTKLYRSPSGLFAVSLGPEIGRDTSHGSVGYQIWKTKTPTLDPDGREASLAMLYEAYGSDAKYSGYSFEVLSLLTPRSYPLIHAGRATDIFSDRVGQFERWIEEFRRKKDEDRPGGRNDRPPPPPP